MSTHALGVRVVIFVIVKHVLPLRPFAPPTHQTFLPFFGDTFFVAWPFRVHPHLVQYVRIVVTNIGSVPGGLLSATSTKNAAPVYPPYTWALARSPTGYPTHTRLSFLAFARLLLRRAWHSVPYLAIFFPSALWVVYPPLRANENEGKHVQH